MNSVFVESLHLPLLASATAVQLAGLGLLYRSWRRRGPATATTGAGWVLMGLSLVPWVLGAGPGRGLSLALATLALAAPLLIAGMTLNAPPPRTRRREPSTPAERGGDRGLIGRGLVRTLVTGPLGFLVSAALAAVVHGHLPGADGNRLFAAFVVLVLGWGGIMAWTASAPSLRRPVLGLTATLAISALLLLPLPGTEMSP